LYFNREGDSEGASVRKGKEDFPGFAPEAFCKFPPSRLPPKTMLLRRLGTLMTRGGGRAALHKRMMSSGVLQYDAEKIASGLVAGNRFMLSKAITVRCIAGFRLIEGGSDFLWRGVLTGFGFDS
jgi:hypothetical protein